MAAPAEHAVPVLEYYRGRHRAVPAQAQHVHAQARIRHVRLLVHARSLQGLDGVALLHRGLEIQPVARLLHFLFPLGNQVVALPVQQHLRLEYRLVVFLLRHEPRARGATPPYVVVEAGPRGLCQRELQLALAYLEQAGGNVLQLAYHAGIHVGPVVLAAVLAHRAGEEQPRERLVHREREVGEMLVVLQQHVVLGRVLPDKVRLQD